MHARHVAEVVAIDRHAHSLAGDVRAERLDVRRVDLPHCAAVPALRTLAARAALPRHLRHARSTGARDR
jgi:hypothetical protein